MTNKIQVLRYYLSFRVKNKFKSRQSLETWQEKMIQKHLHFLSKHSRYYRNLLSTIPSKKQWRKLPVMDKSLMMENFNDLNTVGISKEKAFVIALNSEKTRDFSSKIDNVTVGLSSGTSGNRGIFLVSDKEQERWAGTVLAKLLPNGLFNQERIAFFLRANSNLYESVGNRFLQFRFFDLLNDISSNLSNLKDYNPTIIVAPPSMLRIIAEEIEGKRLRVNPIKVISVAEVLEPLDEQYLKDTFKQNIHQVYQCTEGFLATTCKHGTLHLNEDIIMVEKEYLNEEKTKFSPIITDFSRKSQPIVRYRLNDILTIKKEPCECGSVFTAIDQIEGRCDDIFTFLTKERDTVNIFPDFIRRAVITASLNIEEYRIIQHDFDKVELMLKLINENRKEETEKNVQNLVAQFLEEKKCVVPTITFSKYVRNENGVKLKRVERLKFS